MTFHYMGKYNLDPDTLPSPEHQPGAVAFREPKDLQTLGRIAGGISIGIVLVALGLLYLRGGIRGFSGCGVLLAGLTMVPHELLHALCFREDVYMYTNLRYGMLFVVGPERMSKARFILMSLLPNLVFGLIPFGLYFLFPGLTALGTMGALALSMGAGDYLNVFHAATQMPKGARTYLHKFNSYWYLPEGQQSPGPREQE